MVPVQHVLPTVLLDVVRRQPVTPEKVQFAWRVAAGPAVTRSSEVRLEPDGTLLVIVRDERWRRELTCSLHVIRARLDTLLAGAYSALVVTDGRPAALGGRARPPRS
jgi:Dna[CI] antecedent, DciA